MANPHHRIGSLLLPCIQTGFPFGFLPLLFSWEQHSSQCLWFEVALLNSETPRVLRHLLFGKGLGPLETLLCFHLLMNPAGLRGSITSGCFCLFLFFSGGVKQTQVCQKTLLDENNACLSLAARKVTFTRTKRDTATLVARTDRGGTALRSKRPRRVRTVDDRRLAGHSDASRETWSDGFLHFCWWCLILSLLDICRLLG